MTSSLSALVKTLGVGCVGSVTGDEREVNISSNIANVVIFVSLVLGLTKFQIGDPRKATSLVVVEDSVAWWTVHDL